MTNLPNILDDPYNLGDFRLNYMLPDFRMTIEDAISRPRNGQKILLRPSTARAFENLCRAIKELDEVTADNLAAAERKRDD